MQAKQSSAWLEAKKERKGKAKRNNREKVSSEELQFGLMWSKPYKKK